MGGHHGLNNQSPHGHGMGMRHQNNSGDFGGGNMGGPGHMDHQQN